MRTAFGAALFLAAAALFSLEPAVGRLTLPVLGGAPQVWITCLLFFQSALLAGYLYAHGVARLPTRAQPLVHGALCVAAGLATRVVAPADPGDHFGAVDLLGHLALSVGPSFVLTSATAPLVQSWAHRAALRDPYSLYAASNAGSLAGLVAYPSLLEPLVDLGIQARAWVFVFAALSAVVVGCGVVAAVRARAGERRGGVSAPAATSVSSRELARWVLLAAIPSSLLSGVTTFVTTDVAPIPLFWIAPLACYLASFVVPFSPRPILAHARVLALAPGPLAAMAFAAYALRGRAAWLTVGLHLAGFLTLALACHGELARTKPGAERSTVFYLAVAFGGVVGSALNALVAPLAFPALWEYPLALGAATVVVALARARAAEASRLDLAIGGAAGLALVVAAVAPVGRAREVVVLVVGGAAAAFALASARRAPRFTFVTLALFLAPEASAALDETLARERSFFGVHRVIAAAGGARHVYVQGTTIHGAQDVAEGRRRIAGAYYHATGPAGVIMEAARPRRVGLVGLGVGALATYAEAGQRFTFYEIDAAVIRIAEDPRLFSFLRDARGRGAEVVVVPGDARLTLARAPDRGLDAVVLDAYSSDMVPVHLLTVEALRMYLSKLDEGGFVLANVTNRFLDLGPVLAAAAREASAVAYERRDVAEAEAAQRDGKSSSRWVLVRRATEAGAAPPGWTTADGASRPWRDDRAAVIRSVRLGGR